MGARGLSRLPKNCMEGLGVWGLAFRVQGLGFRVQGFLIVKAHGPIVPTIPRPAFHIVTVKKLGKRGDVVLRAWVLGFWGLRVEGFRV